ncbi:ACT domain-containing protein, partial [Francisellaceae bacterium]|nr:ACT domain-containing protein [Francisellaceae bacterium]
PKLLSMVLNAIAKYDIDLTKIESRPTRNQAWEYMFFLDFKGHRDDENIRLALSEVAILTDYLNVLGSYQTVHY